MTGQITCDSIATLCNNAVGSSNLVTGKVEYSNYGYLLSSWSVYLFLSVFIVAFFAHVALASWKRIWWVAITMGLGTAIEAIGWGGRVWSKTTTTWNPNDGGLWRLNFNGFIMQTVCLVLAPTFYSAANYILLGRLIRKTGPSYCSLSPSSFAKIFMTCDFLCLIVQAIGGGIAGTAVTLAGSNNGGYIMTAGVVLQLLVTIVYLSLLCEFLYRKSRNVLPKKQFDPIPEFKCIGKRDRHDSNSSVNSTAPLNGPRRSEEGYSGTKERFQGQGQEVEGVKFGLTIFMICWTTLLIVIRSIYRSVELSAGWTGPIATNQALFIGMDAFLMALLAWSYLVVHPSILLNQHRI